MSVLSFRCCNRVYPSRHCLARCTKRCRDVQKGQRSGKAFAFVFKGSIEVCWLRPTLKQYKQNQNININIFNHCFVLIPWQLFPTEMIWLVTVFKNKHIHVKDELCAFRCWVWSRTWVFSSVPIAIIRHTFLAQMGLKSWLRLLVLRCLVRPFCIKYYIMTDWFSI